MELVSKEDHSGKAGLVNEAKDLFDSIAGNSSNPADKEVELTTTGQPPVVIEDGDVMQGSIEITRSKDNHRLMDVKITHELRSSGKQFYPAMVLKSSWFRMIYGVKLGVVPPKVSRSLRIKLPSRTYFRVAVMVARENHEIPTGLHLDVRDLEPQAAFYISEENGTFYLTDANDNTFKSSRMLQDEKLVVK
ncbi:hypothetical protein SELMODRAFT_415805 [Selaginella moellendorffii]|uniref:Uncharacterized protein n=1 Tax=Selaginella moellendorffii TaxID=88036 RepID=D8RXA6_SELML|nr:hypothetical protein SELMODRAFT_415805 [Selaginella moellendorffii]